MLVRFFEHGKVKKGAVTRTGGGGDARSYLLFDSKDKTKLRENARLIYGDDVATTEIINGIKNLKVYTSGVLSFAPEESVTEAQKIEIIESFERNLFPGMTAGEYSGYWVEHLDKERQELHFVFADIHLPTGRALPVYYDGKDLNLVDSWKELINYDYGLESPNDLKRQRAYRLKGYEYALKKQEQQKEKEREQANLQENLSEKQQGSTLALKKDLPATVVAPRKFDEEEIGEWLIGEIIDNESIQTQEDVIALLRETFEVTRVAKDGKSISIKNPAGGRNIKLKGMMYEREFSRERFESLGKTQTGKVVERADLVERNRVEVERRLNRLQQRFKQYYQQLAELGRDIELESQQPSPADGRQSYRVSESELDGIDQQAGASPTGFNEPDGATIPSGGSGRTADSGFETNAAQFSEPEPNRDSRLRPELAATSPNEYATQRETVSGVLSGTEQETSKYASEGVDGGVGHLLSGDVANGGNAGSDILFKTPDDRAKSAAGASTAGGENRGAESGNHYDQGAANPNRGSNAQYGDGVAQRPEPVPAVDYPQEPASGRLWGESEGAEGVVGGARDTPQKYAEQVNQSEPQGVNDGRSQSERAYRPKLSDIVERFAPEGGYSFNPTERATADSGQSGAFTFNTDVIATVIADYHAGSAETEPTDAAPSGSLLERIKDYESTTVKNAEIRQGRVSNLTRQDENHVDRVGPAIATRRRRGKKFIEHTTDLDKQLTDPSDQLAEITAGYQDRTRNLKSTNRRLRNAKNGYGSNAQGFKTTTDELGLIVGAVSAIVEAIIALFKKLFDRLTQKALGYAGEGLLYHMNQDGVRGKQATTQETKDYVNSHPYDLSGYARLELTINTWEKQKKEKDNTPQFRGFGM